MTEEEMKALVCPELSHVLSSTHKSSFVERNCIGGRCVNFNFKKEMYVDVGFGPTGSIREPAVCSCKLWSTQ